MSDFFFSQNGKTQWIGRRYRLEATLSKFTGLIGQVTFSSKEYFDLIDIKAAKTPKKKSPCHRCADPSLPLTGESLPVPAQTRKVKSELLREVRGRVGELESSLNVGFQYKDPVKDFDRSSVKGVVAKLFSVADISNATALEVHSFSAPSPRLDLRDLYPDHGWLVWNG